MKVVSGITTLECSDLLAMAGIADGVCCPNCHSRKPTQQLNIMEGKTGLIYLRPPRPPSNPSWGVDWSLHLAAEVCCKYVDVVLAQPHEWWKVRAIELKTDEAHKLHYYGHKLGHAGVMAETSKGVSNVKEKKVKKVGKTCLLCGEPSEEDVCASCGG